MGSWEQEGNDSDKYNQQPWNLKQQEACLVNIAAWQRLKFLLRLYVYQRRLNYVCNSFLNKSLSFSEHWMEKTRGQLIENTCLS